MNNTTTRTFVVDSVLESATGLSCKCDRFTRSLRHTRFAAAAFGARHTDSRRDVLLDSGRRVRYP